MKTVSIAIVGLGSIAEYHLRAFRKTEGCRLHAVMSRKRETVERVVKDYDVEQGYVRWEDVLTDADVEAVVLCTPNDTHYAMTVQALNAGKHVLVEKPLAGNVQEAEDLCRLAERCGRRLMVAMTARFTPQYLTAWHCLRSGTIGEPIQFIIRWLEPKTIGINWEKKPVPVDAVTGTVLYHHGSHMLDAALWFAEDEPAEVYAVGTRHQRLMDDVAVIVKTRRGQLITSVHSFNAPAKTHDFVAVGTRGILEINAYERLSLNGEIRIQTTWQQGLEQGVDNQSLEFIQSLQADREPIASGRQVLPSFRVLEQAYALTVRQGAL